LASASGGVAQVGRSAAIKQQRTSNDRTPRFCWRALNALGIGRRIWRQYRQPAKTISNVDKPAMVSGRCGGVAWAMSSNLVIRRGGCA